MHWVVAVASTTAAWPLAVHEQGKEKEFHPQLGAWVPESAYAD